MNRSRLISILLFVILLGCVAVIALDQLGMFGGPQTVNAPASPPATPTPLPGTPSTSDGYGDLK